MYYLYLDESGDHDDYLDDYRRIIANRSKFFTLGGIIVKDENRILFEQHFDNLMSKYFGGITLPEKFKLHYHKIRQRSPPYNQLTDPNRYAVMNEVFDKIVNCDCRLLSVTIDKERHCKKYSQPANPLGYILFLMLERFQYFLDEVQDEGIVIYERYNSNIRHAVDRVHRWLRSLPNFPTRTNFDSIVRSVVNGDPCSEPILQYADFFAYVPWILSTTDGKANRRYNQIKHKYYNLDYWYSYERGNVVI